LPEVLSSRIRGHRLADYVLDPDLVRETVLEWVTEALNSCASDGERRRAGRSIDAREHFWCLLCEAMAKALRPVDDLRTLVELGPPGPLGTLGRAPGGRRRVSTRMARHDDCTCPHMRSLLTRGVDPTDRPSGHHVPPMPATAPRRSTTKWAAARGVATTPLSMRGTVRT